MQNVDREIMSSFRTQLEEQRPDRLIARHIFSRLRLAPRNQGAPQMRGDQRRA
jgi:hypothetical protein